MTGFKSKQAAAQAKLTDDDDIQEYKRPWVGLTEEELEELGKTIDRFVPLSEGKRLYAKAIEQALKEKNT